MFSGPSNINTVWPVNDGAARKGRGVGDDFSIINIF
jgi:hypothetical protein